MKSTCSSPPVALLNVRWYAEPIATVVLYPAVRQASPSLAEANMGIMPSRHMAIVSRNDFMSLRFLFYLYIKSRTGLKIYHSCTDFCSMNHFVNALNRVEVVDDGLQFVE